MANNKSIDGLTLRDATKTAGSPVRTTKKPAQSFSKPKKVAKTSTTKTTTPKPPTVKSHKATVDDFLSPIQALNFDDDTTHSSGQPQPKPASILAKYTMHTRPTKMKKSQKSTKKTKKPISKARRIISTIALLLVLGLIGIIIWAVLWGNDLIAKLTGGQGTVLDLVTFVNETYTPLKTDENGRTNILAFGTSGYDMTGSVDESGWIHDGAQLTDSIMMISLDQETGDVALLSIPRDFKASPTCTATGKINEIFWCNNRNGNDEVAGATALMTEVSSILGVDFQYYAHLNWGSLVSIVDILGGITVVLDDDVSDYIWTGAVYEAGVPYTLTGEAALNLARARHGTIGGDFTRGANQQKILIGIKNRALEKNLSLIDVVNLASTLGDNLRTNFTLDEIKTIAHIFTTLNLDNMRQISLIRPVYYLSTGNINGISYVLPSAGVGNYGAIQNYVAEQISSDPRVRERPSILVLNATDEYGLAAAEKEELVAEGYQIADIDNAPEGTSFSDDYTIYINEGELSGTKAMLEKRYSITAKPITDAPSSISRDYDLVIIIGPTAAESIPEEYN